MNEGVKALVLRKIPYGEKDSIVSFFTEENEVVTTFAASARNSKRRFPHQFDFSGVFEIESRGAKIRLKDRRDQLFRLHRCDLLEFSSTLRADWFAIARWAVVMEWIHSDDVFEMSFEDILLLREKIASPAHALCSQAFSLFLAHQIESHGVRPQLSQCVFCHEEIHREKLTRSVLGFSMAQGGVFHTQCATSSPFQKISVAAYEQLLELFDLKEKEEKSLLPEVEILLIEFLEHQLGKKIKSKSFLLELGAEQSTTR